MARFDILLKNKLSKKELKELRTSLDILGDAAIIEIPKKLARKQSLIGRAVLKANPQLRAVFKKASPVRGAYRIRSLARIAGKGSTLVTYRENSCAFRFDLQKVFFTPRMSSERMRVAKQVKANETVIDMFSGVGPFSILIAKIQPKVKAIYAIDSNMEAINYLIESSAMNRVSHKIIAFTGDSRDVIKTQPFLHRAADRIIMNLPLTKENFFPEALLALKKKGILHFYTFAKTEKEVKSLVKKHLKTSFRIILIRKIRQYAPRVWNFVADIKAERNLNKSEPREPKVPPV